MTEENIIKLLSGKISMYKRENSPHYHYYFRYNNKTYRGSTHSKNLDSSEEYCVLKYHKVKSGKEKIVNEKSFEDCVKKFLELKQSTIKSNTMKDYVLETRYLKEYFGNTDPNSITSNDLDEYETWRLNYYKKYPNKCSYNYIVRNHKRKSHKNFTVGNSTTNKEILLLISILKTCHQKDYIKIDKLPHWDKKPEKIRKDILTRDEYLKLKEYYLKKNEHYKWSIISFIQNTGLRNSEWLELKWGDINFKDSFMTIRNRKQRKDKDKIWTVPIVGTTRRILDELKNRPNVDTEEGDYVFVNNDNNRICDISRTFKKYLKECGINKPLCIHSLRHTYCSRILTTRPDIPLYILSESMGHVSTLQIQRTYGHIKTRDVVKFFERSEETKQHIIVERERKNSQIQKPDNHTTENHITEPPSYVDLYEQEP